MGDISIRGEIFEVVQSQDLNSAPLSFTTSFNTDFTLLAILVRSATSSTQTFSVTLDSLNGSNYDAVLESLSINIQNRAWGPAISPLKFKKGNELKVDITNTGIVVSTLVYVTLIAEQA